MGHKLTAITAIGIEYEGVGLNHQLAWKCRRMDMCVDE